MKIQNQKLSVALIGQVEGSQRLPTIRSLGLSGYGIEELPVEVMKNLTNLKSLDLSCNNITTFPDVQLKNLDTLDLTENKLQSLDFVKNFPKLRSLMISENPDITEAQYLEAILKCPTITHINNKHEKVDLLRRQIEHTKSKWKIQVQAKFEVLFEDQMMDEMSDEQFSSALEYFQNEFKKDQLFAEANTDIERYVVEQLVLETAKDARSGELFCSDLAVPGTPRSARLSKKQNTPQTPNSVRKTSKKVGSMLDSPTLRMPKSPVTPIKSPSNKKRRRDSDSGSDSGSVRKSKRDRKYSPLTWQTRDVTKTEHTFSSLPETHDYDPVYFIRCHSEKNDPSDENTKVWKCLFEPKTDEPGKTTNILATCGGQIVCLIDCNTGKVMKRYKDNNKNECFYTLAWTTVALNNNKKEKANILAVAGQSADIKLIHPANVKMYATLEGHRKYISCLTFHPTEPTILFSGGNDGRIIIWDIGIPDMKDYSVNFRRLHVMQAPDTDALNLVLSMPSKILLAGCEDSCFGWNMTNLKDVSREPDYQFYLPTVSSDEESNISTQREIVDGLVALQNGYVVTKCVGEDILSLWNVQKQLSASKKTGDKRSRMQKVTVNASAMLHYTKQDVDYIGMGATKDMMLVGDDSGSLRLYNLEALTDKRAKISDNILKPSRVLLWPEISVGPMKSFCVQEDVIVNSTCVSHDKDFIASGTDNNLVCIWRKNNNTLEEDMICD